MSFAKKVGDFVRKILYNSKWRCLICGKEIFDEDKRICVECESTLPYNDGAICEHCGRKVTVTQSYCTTCKGVLTNLDACRSCFSYEKPIDKLIKDVKYSNKRYVVDYLAERLALLYLKNYFNADGFVYIPMTEKAFRDRGYNQSQLLALKVSEITGVPVIDCLKKVKDTKRQATLNRNERLKNLNNAFKVIDKKAVADKTLVIVDDVTTTGSTAQVIAGRLKNAGAKKVYLITVASTPPIDRY